MSKMTTNVSPTTIVVPLYGDLPTAERCIRSVIETVDLSTHRLLVINDVGPEVDAIETLALGLLDGVAGTRYERNAQNLGFVGTCNRAVFELDQSDNDILLLNSDAALTAGALEEMSRVLHLSEKHGVATARSNHATIATIPLRPRSGREASQLRSREVFDAVSPKLPRYTIVPVAHGFCFLVRRSLIRVHGFFDEAFAPGYGEENDFCLRVNFAGYSSVMANRAYTLHEGEASFSTLEKQTIKDEHEELILERYWLYPGALAHYFHDGVDIVDWFADFLVPSSERRKILIDLHHMSLIYNGSVRNALTFLEFLRAARERGEIEGLEFVVGASSEGIDFFQLDRFGFRTVANAHLDELFDLGFSLAPVNAHAQIARLNRLCVRWVASHLDIIALRTLSLLEVDYSRKQVVFDSLRFADRVVAISRATVDDTVAYFPSLAARLNERVTVIHQGVADISPTGEAKAFDHHHALPQRQDDVVRAGGYVLVVGNEFKHKQLEKAVDALRGSTRAVVAFGSLEKDLGDNVVPIKGGFLPDADVALLYEQAAVVVFPSSYEGFGLPIAEAALHGAPLIVFDTEVAHEVVNALGIQESTTFIDDFRDFDAVVETVANSQRTVASLRTLDDYNAEVLEVLRGVLDEPVSVDALRQRADYFRAVSTYQEAAFERARSIEWHLNRRSFRLADALVRRLEFLRPVARRARRLLGPGRR